MADQDRQQQQQQQQQALSAFPAPPPFYKHFTPDNLLRVKELQDSGQDIPPELRPLLPPAPPEEGTYHSFGDPYHVRSLYTPFIYSLPTPHCSRSPKSSLP